MKGLSLSNKIIFVLNLVVALLLVLACFAPYLSVEHFSFLSFLSLIVPLLVGVNLLFLLYWSLRRKRQLQVSLFVLLIGFFAFGFFIKLNYSDAQDSDDGLSIMSYNARAFNRYKWIKNDSLVSDKIIEHVRKNAPDIICFQEFNWARENDFKAYPYKWLTPYGIRVGRSMQAIYSKYPIIDSGSLDLSNTINNIIYADILYKQDTLRIYNVHLQSLGITPGSGFLRNASSERLYNRLSASFIQQEEQAKIFTEHESMVTHKVVVCGDFNNTQFSRTYHIVKGDKQDTFNEQGSGYGRTFLFHGLPLRIDFILSDPEFEVLRHKTFDDKLSDHYSIMASFSLKED